MKLKALVVQSCLCNPVDCMDRSPRSSSAHGILQASVLEWVAILQGIFPTQGLNLGLCVVGRFFYCLSDQGSPGSIKTSPQRTTLQRGVMELHTQQCVFNSQSESVGNAKVQEAVSLEQEKTRFVEAEPEMTELMEKTGKDVKTLAINMFICLRA